MLDLQAQLEMSRQQGTTLADRAASLQCQLLQQVVVAEASHAQLTAAAATAHAQALLAKQRKAAAPSKGHSDQDPVAAADVLQLLTREVAAAKGMEQQLQLPEETRSLLGMDPKLQRIQELRNALATALEQLQAPGAPSGLTAEHSSSSAGSMDAGEGAAAAASSGGNQMFNLGEPEEAQPKVERIHHLTSLLVAAARDARAPSPVLANSMAKAAGQSDAKCQRIAELRAALLEAHQDNQRLQQQLRQQPSLSDIGCSPYKHAGQVRNCLLCPVSVHSAHAAAELCPTNGMMSARSMASAAHCEVPFGSYSAQVERLLLPWYAGHWCTFAATAAAAADEDCARCGPHAAASSSTTGDSLFAAAAVGSCIHT